MGYFCPEKQQCHPAVPLSQTMTHGHAPTPQNILSSTCFFYICVFYFISYLLQTVTHDQSSKPHNILSCTRLFFRFSCFIHYPIHYIQTKPPQPKTASQVLGFYVSLHFLQTMTYRCIPADSLTYCQKKNCVTYQHFVVGF